MPKTKKSNEKQEEKEKEFIPNPKELDGVPDLSQLVYLEMDHVLHNLKHRYKEMPRKYCYTSISTILIAINPYERLNIYGQGVIDEFYNAQKDWRIPSGRPHPYGVSSRSYQKMVQLKKNQSIIVCGESGAGKTVTTKFLMKYLAMTAPPDPRNDKFSSTKENIGGVEQQIIAASPILEAYGNAKTLMNNNSSRFGKFTKLLYNIPGKSLEGYILGSYLETYLLEKSRVVFQNPNERNYHIFYFLHAGIPKEDYGKYFLSSPDDFYYTKQGNCSKVQGVSDIGRWEELVESMKLMRIDKELNDLWKITCGLLNLGNVEFKKGGDGYGIVKNFDQIEKVCKLWEIDPKMLKERLETKTMVVANKTIVQKINFSDCIINRDSITKGFYEQVFLWLCKRINAELYNENDNDNDEDENNNTYFIGILDVFGFENFWINSFEQFCINFTNEKLQQFFNYHIIKSEQEEYIKESVIWTPLSVPDNEEYINLIEDKKKGFFKILDSNCNAPQPDPKAFMQELFKNHKNNKCITKSMKPGSGHARGKPKKRNKRMKFDGFTIKHFADDVTYDSQAFLAKNNEAVHGDTAKMLKKSKNKLVQDISQLGITNSKKKKSKKKKSVSAVFFNGIKTLMKNLSKTEPFFVRCCNPNSVKSKEIWDPKTVEGQLRCGGIVEALKVLKLGYPTRVPYNTLYDKYHANITNPLMKNMDSASFSTALLIAFDVVEKDYELGLTKIFFKPSKAAVLETIMSKAGQPLTDDQNKKITKWIVSKRIKQMIGVCKTFCEFRKRIRLTRAAILWRNVGRITSIISHTVIRHLNIAKKTVLERRRNAAASKIQTFFRGNYEKNRYNKRIEKVKTISKMLWISYRRYNERQLLNKWLDKKVEETKERKRIEYEENMKKEEFARKEKERLRKEKEKLEEIEKLRKKAQEEALKRKQKEDELAKQKLDQEKLLAEQRIKNNSINIKKHKMEEQRENRKKLKDIRKKSIEFKKQQNQNEEKQRKETKRIKNLKNAMLEKYGDSDNDNDDSDYEYDNYYDEEEEIISIEQQLRSFSKTSSNGQFFFKYAGKKHRKPQERIVKITYDDRGNAKQICWGRGNRFIDIDDILYISWGHWTPAFQIRKDKLDPNLCLSVVAKNQILDLKAQTRQICELWVKGLRKLIGQSNDEALKLSRQNLNKHLNNSNNKEKRKQQRKENSKRAEAILRLQQDLFIMTVTTVFRNLEEERIYHIDKFTREKFSPKNLYEQALKKDIHWKKWNPFVKNIVVKYLKENNKYLNNNNNDNTNMNMNNNLMYQMNPFGQPMQPQQYKHYYNVQPNMNMNSNMNINNNQIQSQPYVQYVYPNTNYMQDPNNSYNSQHNLKINDPNNINNNNNNNNNMNYNPNNMQDPNQVCSVM